MDNQDFPPAPAPQAPILAAKKPLSPLTLVLLLSGSFFVLFLLISGALFLIKSPSKGHHSSKSALFSGGSVGVLELNGVIMDSKATLKSLDTLEEDDAVKAIVLRLNSPGGSVAPSQEIYQAVRDSKKPIVVSMASVAASGAYYVAMGAKKVYANPGTITGSIGVIMEFANLSKLYEWAKVQRYVIKTGKFKDTGSEFRDMQPEERALLQGMVDNVLGQFKKAVSDGRKLSLEQVTAIADGRIFSGEQAKAAHLVDELGSLDDAINDAGKTAGINGKPHVVYPEKPHKRLLEMLMDEKDESSEAPASAGLLERFLGRLIGASTTSEVEKVLPLHPGLYWIWRGSL